MMENSRLQTNQQKTKSDSALSFNNNNILYSSQLMFPSSSYVTR